MAELAERTGIPVAALQYSPDAFPSTHALALGPLGRNGCTSANRTVPKADVIVAIGAHIDVFSTMFKYGIFSEQAKLVHHSVGAGPDRHRVPGDARRRGVDGELHRRTHRARSEGGDCANRGST